jgi:hypothetical protein
MIHFVQSSIGFVLAVFLVIDLIDKILCWRVNHLSLPKVLASPEFRSKTAALKYWLRHRRYGLAWIENNLQETVGWLTLLILFLVLSLI